ncbi:EAL domain-containing protein [Eubacteriales bacterium OttesenSCG-928-M02]|nr:EAL domain-containing protein [Eubacteriales bacterium OttesenSCG-928-M02]
MLSNVTRFFTKMENSKIFSSIKRGFILLIPILITGSLAVLLRNIPIDGYRAVMDTTLHWLDQGLIILWNGTLGMMSVYLVLSISYYYAAQLCEVPMMRIISMLAALGSFITSLGIASSSLSLGDLGPRGVFMAMICAIIATRLFFLVYGLLSNRTRYYSGGEDAAFRNAMDAIIPFAICLAAFVLINYAITFFSNNGDIFNAAGLPAEERVNNLNDLIARWMTNLFRWVGGGLPGGLLFTFMLNFFWAFGMHGGNVMENVGLDYFEPYNTDPTAIVSKSFMDNFAAMGGSGCTICLIIALLLFSKSRSNRRLPKAALPFALFNINEILVYGMPIVWNPVMMIPFMLVPLVSLLIAYGFTALGLMPVVVETVTWTSPVLISGYAATGSIWGTIVQLISLLAGVCIYLPFVRLSERMQAAQEAQRLELLTETFKQNEVAGIDDNFLDREDAIGAIAKTIINQLRADLKMGAIPIHYQPQVNQERVVIGAEALLRWTYNGHTLYPPVLLSLAKEDHCFDDLSQCILEQAARDARRLRDVMGENFLLSANITPVQLNDKAFIQHVIALAKAEDVCGNFGLEVTEESSLVYLDSIGENIEALRQNGIVIAIDDFSMGQTSLKYLQNNGFQFVKLDGQLVKQVDKNPRNREIIGSIISLGTSLDFSIVAEHVETESIFQALIDLGCDEFQGFLFGKAIPLEEFTVTHGRQPLSP